MVKVPDERPNGYAIHASVWTVISIWPSSVKVVRLWNERKGGWEDGNFERERETLLGNNDNEPSGFQ